MNNALTSPIAVFLRLQTKFLNVIRDNIPAGPENFHFYHKDKEINWYEFWNTIADNEAFGMRFETGFYQIKYNDLLMVWELTMNTADMDLNDHNYFKAKGELVLSNIEQFNNKARELRAWEHFRQHNTIKKTA